MEVKPKIRIVRNARPAQRRRTRPVRKWKHAEITLLIDYLNRNRDFEKPSQRIYYQNFIRQYGIDIPWDLIKCKVRNLRTKYIKFRDLLNSGNREKTMYINESCPYFDQLELLFEGKGAPFGSKGETESATDVYNISMDSSNITNFFKMEEVSLDQHPKVPDNITVPRTIPNTEPILLKHHPLIIKDEIEWETDVSEIQQNNIEARAVNTSINGTDSHSFNTFHAPPVVHDPKPVDLLLTSPHQLTPELNKSHWSNETPEIKPLVTELEMLKFNFEKEKFLRRMALKEKIVEFQIESARKKYELKTVALELEKIKIEKDLHLAKLRLEFDERLTNKNLEFNQREAD